MPDAAVRLARQVEVRTPAHLIRLRERVRKEHHGQFAEIQAAIDARFERPARGTTMERVLWRRGDGSDGVGGRDELPAEDRASLRELWEALLVHIQFSPPLTAADRC
jgi:hypothetical protein